MDARCARWIVPPSRCSSAASASSKPGWPELQAKRWQTGSRKPSAGTPPPPSRSEGTGGTCLVAFTGPVPGSSSSTLDCLQVPVTVNLSYAGSGIAVSATGSTSAQGFNISYTGSATMQ